MSKTGTPWTPGPYEVRVSGRGVGIVAPKPTKDWPNGEHIASMTSGRPNIHANAALFAAAPEMAELLKRLSVDWSSRTAQELAIEARALLTRIKGQDQ